MEDLTPLIEHLGERHAGYGVRKEHYLTLEQALIAMLEKCLGPNFTPETRLAWACVYELLASTMIEAAQIQ